MPKFERLLAKELGLIFRDDDPVWCSAREVAISGGIRAGKSLRQAFRGLIKALNPTARLIWIVGPTYPLANEEFRYMLEWGTRLGAIEESSISIPAEGSRKMRFITGCVVETRSGEHAQRLAASAPDMILLTEPSQLSSDVYDACIGRLVQKRGTLYMCGTLDDNTGRPRFQWYENLVRDWLDNPPGSNERAFCLPTWTNTVEFPLGEMDPAIISARAKVGDWKFSRMYGGRPEGVEHPVFPLLWEQGAEYEFLRSPENEVVWQGGCIGVDWGLTWEHPSGVVAITTDNFGRHWVREAWKGFRVSRNELESIVESFKSRYKIWQVCTDPLQEVLAETLGGVAASRGPNTTEFRFTIVNTALENRCLFFDVNGNMVREVWSSMRMLNRSIAKNGELKYDRPLGDDLAQCVAYALEAIQSTPVSNTYYIVPPPMRVLYAPASHVDYRT